MDDTELALVGGFSDCLNIVLEVETVAADEGRRAEATLARLKSLTTNSGFETFLTPNSGLAPNPGFEIEDGFATNFNLEAVPGFTLPEPAIVSLATCTTFATDIDFLVLVYATDTVVLLFRATTEFPNSI